MAYYFKGAGSCYIRKFDASTPYTKVSNVSKLALTVNETTETLKDFDSATGGSVMQISTIDSVDVEMTLNDLDPTTLARALWGETSDTTASTDTDTFVSYKGSFLPTTYVNPSSVTLTGGGTVTLNTDYIIKSTGIYIPETSGIADGTTITIGYSYSNAVNVEALTTGAQEYTVLLDGLNVANSSKPVAVRLYKVKFSPLQGLDFKSASFAEYSIKGTLLKNESITASGKSQYFQVALVE